MSTPLGIGPAVMINRIVDRTETPAGAQLAKVAQLRMELALAVDAERAAAALLHPGSEVEPPVIDSGAAVDRLV
jgi:hypothetical protein